MLTQAIDAGFYTGRVLLVGQRRVAAIGVKLTGKLGAVTAVGKLAPGAARVYRANLPAYKGRPEHAALDRLTARAFFPILEALITETPAPVDFGTHEICSLPLQTMRAEPLLNLLTGCPVLNGGGRIDRRYRMYGARMKADRLWAAVTCCKDTLCGRISNIPS